MPGNYPTMYQRARKESPYTQEQAAQRLFVSEKTVKAWEQGQRVPDNEMVSRMADLYGTPWLLLERAFEVLSELGILPGGIHAKNMQTGVLSLMDSSNRLYDGFRRLIEITADDWIDDTEKADFAEIQNVILGNVVAGLQVALAWKEMPEEKKDRPVAGTTKRPVPGRASENDCKTIVSHRAGIASPNFCLGGGASL